MRREGPFWNGQSQGPLYSSTLLRYFYCSITNLRTREVDQRGTPLSPDAQSELYLGGTHAAFSLADGALLPSSRGAGPQSWRGFPGGPCAKSVSPTGSFPKEGGEAGGRGVPFSLCSVPPLNQTVAVGGSTQVERLPHLAQQGPNSSSLQQNQNSKHHLSKKRHFK